VISVAFSRFKNVEFGPNCSLKESLRIFAGIYVLLVERRTTTDVVAVAAAVSFMNFSQIRLLFYLDLPMCMIIVFVGIPEGGFADLSWWTFL